MNQDACLLCGAATDTVYQLVRLADGDEQPFAALSRCRDRNACRQRCETTGEVWPLSEASVSDTSSVRHFTEAHRRVFAAAKRWRESREPAA